MPILPLIDLLILLGWTSLLIGFAQKAIWISTQYRPGLFGMSPMDFVVLAGICLVFALSLAARTWVKLNEPRVLAMQRSYDRGRRARALETPRASDGAPVPADDERVDDGDEPGSVPFPGSPGPRTASADHR